MKKIDLAEIIYSPLNGEWGNEDISGKGPFVIRTANFTNTGFINYSSLVTRDIPQKKLVKKRLQVGDIIIEKSGGSDKQPVGRVVYFDRNDGFFTFNNFTSVLRIKDFKIWNPKFVFFSLYVSYQKGETKRFENKTTGLHNLKLDSYIKHCKIPDIPLEEQNKIVCRIEKIEDIVTKRKKQLEYLNMIVKSRFVELFGDPVLNNKNWKVYKLGECLNRIDNGKSFTCSNNLRIKDYPAILKLSAVTYGDYRPNENKALIEEKQFLESAEVHKGDLLFTRKNTPELVGMAAYVFETPSKLMMPDLIFRLVPNERLNSIFLWQLLTNTNFRVLIRSISNGSAKSMSNISKDRLSRISIICPPIHEQQKIEECIYQVDKSRLAVQKSLDELEILKKSLLQEYFG